MKNKITFDGIEVSYTVFPTVARFTGEYALTRAVRWAEKIKTATPSQRVTIKNEMGNVICDK